MLKVTFLEAVRRHLKFVLFNCLMRTGVKHNIICVCVCVWWEGGGVAEGAKTLNLSQ